MPHPPSLTTPLTAIKVRCSLTMMARGAALSRWSRRALALPMPLGPRPYTPPSQSSRCGVPLTIIARAAAVNRCSRRAHVHAPGTP